MARESTLATITESQEFQEVRTMGDLKEEIIKRMDRMEQRMDRMEQRMDRMMEILIQQGETLKQQGETLKQQGETLKQHGKMLEALNQAEYSRKGRFDHLETLIMQMETRLEGRIDTLEDTVKENTQAIRTLEERTEANTQEIRGLKERTEANTQEIRGLKERTEANTQEIRGLAQQMSESQKSSAKAYSSMNARINVLESEVVELKGQKQERSKLSPSSFHRTQRTSSTLFPSDREMKK